MTQQSPSVGNMISQSRDILAKRDVATFEKYETTGNLTNALIYVAIAAAITGLLGLGQGIGGFLSGIIGTLVGFVVFTYLVYWIGKQRGGTGTFDEVAYTFSLFWAPLAVIFGVGSLILAITIIGIVFIPFWLILGLVANIYFAYMAVQSSMNIEQGGKAWGTLILAGLGTLVFNILLGLITSIGQ